MWGRERRPIKNDTTIANPVQNVSAGDWYNNPTEHVNERLHTLSDTGLPPSGHSYSVGTNDVSDANLFDLKGKMMAQVDGLPKRVYKGRMLSSLC